MPLNSKLLGVFLLTSPSRTFSRHLAQRSAFASNAFVRIAAVSSSATSAVLTTAIPAPARSTGSFATAETNPSTSSRQLCSMSSGEFSSRSVDEVTNASVFNDPKGSTACRLFLCFERALCYCRPYTAEKTSCIPDLPGTCGNVTCSNASPVLVAMPRDFDG